MEMEVPMKSGMGPRYSRIGTTAISACSIFSMG